MTAILSRRGFLARGGAVLGCSAAAHPLMSTVSFASGLGEQRLVVLILRGAMDGLDVVRPVGDPGYAALRAGLMANDAGPGIPLTPFWTMHPALAPLAPLWAVGDLGFVQAVSTPYRDKRSHFDGQDLLEAGTGMDVPAAAARSGWLNRMLQTVPGLTGETAYAIGREDLLVLAGAAEVMNWSPAASLEMTPQMRLLLDEVYHDDPLFRDTAAEAMALADLARPDASPRGVALAEAMKKRGGSAVEALAAFAADRLYADARIAAFSVPGWDTHRNQSGGIARALARLSETILTLQLGLGDVWDRTTVLAMTEFGRTVGENGSGGTDHGTGGAMLLAGGALRGGRVLGRWPGLDEASLYDRRDLMPTGDVRAVAAWALRSAYGIDRRLLEGAVFPGLDMGADPGLLL